MPAQSPVFPMNAPLQVPADTFLGAEVSGGFPFLQPENFLEVLGWADSATVTAASLNRFARLDSMERLCNSDDETVGRLKDYRFWYYAEVYETERLAGLLNAPESGLSEVIGKLKEPLLLCYYLFYPGHDDPLQGCEGTVTGPMFGSFAGEWACIAILLEKYFGQTDHTPTWMGLTNRNVGAIDFLGQEVRIGMTIHDWNAISRRLPTARSIRCSTSRGARMDCTTSPVRSPLPPSRRTIPRPVRAAGPNSRGRHWPISFLRRRRRRQRRPHRRSPFRRKTTSNS